MIRELKQTLINSKLDISILRVKSRTPNDDVDPPPNIHPCFNCTVEDEATKTLTGAEKKTRKRELQPFNLKLNYSTALSNQQANQLGKPVAAFADESISCYAIREETTSIQVFPVSAIHETF